MQTVLKYLRYGLPLAYLGYAVAANAWVFLNHGQLDTAPAGRLLDGTAAAGFEKAYSRAMPHREPAISLIGATRYALVGEGRPGVVVGRNGWLFTAEELAIADAAGIAEAITHIVAARDLLAYRGTDLVLVPIPAKTDIHRDVLLMDEAAVAMEAQYRAFVAAVDTADVKLVDTRAALAAPGARAQAFLRTDTHWSPTGAQVVAKAVATSGHIAPGNQALAAHPDGPQGFWGDLVSYVTSDALAPTLGLSREQVVPYVAIASGSDPETSIFADATPATDIVLVGTSYSANRRWSFVPALQIALQRDILNYAAEGQGPAPPMQAFLESDAFRAEPPKVVIWEVPIRYLGAADTWAVTWQGPLLTELGDSNSG